MNPTNTTSLNNQALQASKGTQPQFPGTGLYGTTGSTTYVSCTHDAEDVVYSFTRSSGEVLEFVIANSNGSDPLRKNMTLKADVVLDLAGNLNSLRAQPKLITSGPTEFLDLNSLIPPLPMPKVVRIDWPDYKAVYAPLAFWTGLLEALPRSGRVMITCQGGHGRSGTCMAAIMIASGGYDTDEAVAEIRKIHCKKAVESDSQFAYLDSLSAEAGRPMAGKPEPKGSKPAVELPDATDLGMSNKEYFAKLEEALGKEPDDDLAGALDKETFEYCVYCGRDFSEPGFTDVCQDCADKGREGSIPGFPVGYGQGSW